MPALTDAQKQLLVQTLAKWRSREPSQGGDQAVVLYLFNLLLEPVEAQEAELLRWIDYAVGRLAVDEANVDSEATKLRARLGRERTELEELRMKIRTP